ncbi:MAG: YraN family protein [bacterium]|nr:YraN family protein [bacterium]
MFFHRKKLVDPDWSSRKGVGAWGEEVAARYLENKGYKIVARHFTHRIGEIDIVTAKDSRIIFVEVKTRTNNRFGAPEESIGWSKQEKLRRTANVYMLQHKLYNTPHQIDSLAVMYDKMSKETTIRHLENVVGGR